MYNVQVCPSSITQDKLATADTFVYKSWLQKLNR